MARLSLDGETGFSVKAGFSTFSRSFSKLARSFRSTKINVGLSFGLTSAVFSPSVLAAGERNFSFTGLVSWLRFKYVESKALWASTAIG